MSDETRTYSLRVKCGNSFYAQKQSATALARLCHRNSVYLFVCHTGESVKNGAS